jgi:hypothetical protein
MLRITLGFLIIVLCMIMHSACRHRESTINNCDCLSLPGWTEFESLPSESSSDILVKYVDDTVVEVGFVKTLRNSMDGYYASNDHGKTWRRLNDYPGWHRTRIRVSGAYRSPILYVIDEEDDGSWTLERSFNQGKTWQKMAIQIDGEKAGTHLEIGINGIAEKGKTLLGSFAVLSLGKSGKKHTESRELGGLYISNDYGNNWRLFTKDLELHSPVAASEQFPSTMFGAGKNGIVKSVDGGKSGQPVRQQELLNTPIQIKGRKKALLERKAKGEDIRDWQLRGNFPLVQQMEVIDEECAILARTEAGLMLSYDWGESWCVSRVGGNVFGGLDDFVVSTHNPRLIYIGGMEPLNLHSVLYISKDFGRHFSKVFEIP